MAEPPTPAAAPVQKPAPRPLCEKHPRADRKEQCHGCNRPFCALCLVRVDYGFFCEPCAEAARAKMEAEKPDGKGVALAAAGGLVGALAGGGLFAAVAIGTNKMATVIAVAVGATVGLAVRTAARPKRGGAIQVVAGAFALLAVVAGNYFILAHAITVHIEHDFGPEVAAKHGYFSLETLRIAPKNLGLTLGPMDIAWTFLAVVVAAILTRKTRYWGKKTTLAGGAARPVAPGRSAPARRPKA